MPGLVRRSVFTGSQQSVIALEMDANGFAVDDCAKRAAEIADMIISVTLFNDQMVAR